jgi:hypothetical protein
VLGHAPLSAAPLSAVGGLAARHVVVEADLPATVRERSDAVYFRLAVLAVTGGPVDLTDADSLTAVFRSPAGGLTEAAAEAVDAAAGVVRFPTPVGYLTGPGRWRAQVRATWPGGGVYYSRVVLLRAKANI